MAASELPVGEAEVETLAAAEPAPTAEELEAAQRRRDALAHVRAFGDPILRSKAREVTSFDDDLRVQVMRMGALMHDAQGIGLAAPQVGIANRLLVYRVMTTGSLRVLVNPLVEWASETTEWMEEGCLSLPAVHVDVKRPVDVRVRARDERGDGILVEASGLEARVIQHEIDHLDGVLILDHAKRDQRKQAMRDLREALAEREEQHEH
jgi:peptide deformylase